MLTSTTSGKGTEGMSDPAPVLTTSGTELVADALPGSVFSTTSGELADLERRAAHLRVAFVSDAADSRNGVGTYYRDLVDHLQERLGKAKLFCPYSESTGGHHGRIQVPMPGDPTQKIFFPHVRRISRGIRRLDPHVIVAATPGPFALYGMHVAQRRKLPFVVGFHTHMAQLSQLYWGSIGSIVNRNYFSFVNRVLFNRSVAVLANNQEMSETARSLGAEKVIEVGTPIAKRFLDEPTRHVPGEEMLNVVYAGRIAPEKNVHAMVQAARQMPNLHFFIAGDGPDREKIEAEAKDLSNFTFLGWLKRPQLKEVLDDAHILVLPSSIESFGTIAVEAMSRHTLVLVSSNCGILKWPELAAGLYSIEPNETVADALRRISHLGPEERAAKAETGYLAARALNESTIVQWLEILTQYAEVKA